MSDTYPTWRCLTCQRTGTGDIPARCPSCDSEGDDRHGPVALRVQVTEQCTLRLAVDVTAETRESLLRKMRAIRPARPHRDRAPNYPRALELAAERGEESMRARQPDHSAQPDDKARCVVRIYYRSIGGEILACDSAPLSVGAANALERAMDDNSSWALGTERYRAGDVGPLRSGVRLVTLPSQVRDPVVVVDSGAEEESEPTPALAPPTLTLCAPAATSEAPANPPQPAVWNTYYHEAMARRAARFQAMHRRSIAA